VGDEHAGAHAADSGGHVIDGPGASLWFGEVGVDLTEECGDETKRQVVVETELAGCP